MDCETMWLEGSWVVQGDCNVIVCINREAYVAELYGK